MFTLITWISYSEISFFYKHLLQGEMLLKVPVFSICEQSKHCVEMYYATSTPSSITTWKNGTIRIFYNGTYGRLNAFAQEIESNVRFERPAL